MKFGDIFTMHNGSIGKVTEMFSKGFYYHPIDIDGNCLGSQVYALNDEFNKWVDKFKREQEQVKNGILN